MPRVVPLILALFLASCARGSQCRTIDERALARALAAEVLARSNANADAPGDVGEAGGAPEDGTTRYRIPLAGHPSRGSADALITIVEFGDFQCPFCDRARRTLAELRDRYGDRIRFVYFHRPLPFHEHAELAAEAANEAYVQGGDTAFYRMYELLYDAQRTLDDDTIARVAGEVGLDMTRFQAAIESRVHRPTIDADNTLGERIGARGTPTFFINGIRLVGAQPVEAFTAVIDRELGVATTLVEAGTRPGDVYATLMRTAVDEYVEPPTDDAEGSEEPVAFRPDPDGRYRVAVGTSAQTGPSDALVTIVEFSDFECPFCARASATLDALVDRYGDDIRIVYKHNPLPFHAHARYAAATALEARDQRGHAAFFAMARRFSASWNSLTDESIDSIARDVGLDMNRLTASRANDLHEAEIVADAALAARLSATGTPYFFINGRPLAGAQPLPRFTELIDAELAAARALVASGTPRWQVYLRVLEKGQSVGHEGVEDSSVVGAELAVPTTAIAYGPADAPVVVQVVSDLTSLEASRLESHLAHLRTRFAGRIRIVYRDRPNSTNPLAMKAAEIGREVFAQKGIEGYLAYRAALLGRGPALAAIDPERFAVAAGRANRIALRRALTAATHRRAVDDDTSAIAAAHLDERSLPFVVIASRALTELRSSEEYERALASALGE